MHRRALVVLITLLLFTAHGSVAMNLSAANTAHTAVARVMSPGAETGNMACGDVQTGSHDFPMDHTCTCASGTPCCRSPKSGTPESPVFVTTNHKVPGPPIQIARISNGDATVRETVRFHYSVAPRYPDTPLYQITSTFLI